jgi:hypothetical protein
MMIPKHSKVTVPESHRPTENSVRAGERPEDCRAVGSVLALVGTYPALFVVGVFGTIGCLLLSGMGLVAGLIPRAHVGSIESLSHIALEVPNSANIRLGMLLTGKRNGRARSRRSWTRGHVLPMATYGPEGSPRSAWRCSSRPPNEKARNPTD